MKILTLFRHFILILLFVCRFILQNKEKIFSSLFSPSCHSTKREAGDFNKILLHEFISQKIQNNANS